MTSVPEEAEVDHAEVLKEINEYIRYIDYRTRFRSLTKDEQRQVVAALRQEADELVYAIAHDEKPSG